MIIMSLSNSYYVDACTSIELANTSTKAQRIAAVKVIYEK